LKEIESIMALVVACSLLEKKNVQLNNYFLIIAC